MTLYDMPPPTSPENEPKRIEQYFVLDFDRTLVDSDLLADKIYKAVETNTGVPRENLVERQEELQNNAETGIVDMWTVIEELSPKVYDFSMLRVKIIKELSTQRGECWLPGAEELLEQLQDNDASFGIVTRGASLWQQLKLDCMGLSELPTIITDGHNKSQDHLNGWHDDSKDVFVIPKELSGNTPTVANSLVSIDDRAAAFEGARENITGYWVQTGRNREGTVDQSKIMTCNSLEEVVADISKRYFAQAA